MTCDLECFTGCECAKSPGARKAWDTPAQAASSDSDRGSPFGASPDQVQGVREHTLHQALKLTVSINLRIYLTSYIYHRSIFIYI